MELYEPLPEEEQERLLMLKDNPEVMNKLILHNLRLVHWIAKKYYMPGRNEFDDLFQVGVLGLIKAIKKYDVDRGTKFSTYAVWPIKTAIQRNMFMFTDDVSLDDEIIGADDLTIKDSIPDDGPLPDDEALQAVFIDEFNKEFKPKLTEIEYNVVTSFYGIGCRECSMKVIGEKYNKTPEQVRMIKDRALSVIRKSNFTKRFERNVDSQTQFSNRPFKRLLEGF